MVPRPRNAQRIWISTMTVTNKLKLHQEQQHKLTTKMWTILQQQKLNLKTFKCLTLNITVNFKR